MQHLRTFKSISRFPSIDRDVTLLADIDLPAKRIEDIIRGFSLVSQISLFDVYQGEQVFQGKKSLAFSVRYQSPERTLTDKEVDKVQGKILTKLESDLGVILRK